MHHIVPENYATAEQYRTAIDAHPGINPGLEAGHIRAEANRLRGDIDGLSVSQVPDAGHRQLLTRLRNYDQNSWVGGRDAALNQLHATARYVAGRVAAPLPHLNADLTDSDSDRSSGSEGQRAQIHPAPLNQGGEQG